MPSEESEEVDMVEANGDVNDHTDSATIRVWWLSTVVTLIIVLSFTSLLTAVAFGFAETPGGNAWGVYVLTFLLFAVYVVGPATVQSYKQLKGK